MDQLNRKNTFVNLIKWKILNKSHQQRANSIKTKLSKTIKTLKNRPMNGKLYLLRLKHFHKYYIS